MYCRIIGKSMAAYSKYYLLYYSPSSTRDRRIFAFLTEFSDCCSGRLVIEVFEDQVPLAARWFMNRCREGMADSLQGTKVHRLIPEQALFAGVTRG
jgi:hypothetical protein